MSLLVTIHFLILTIIDRSRECPQACLHSRDSKASGYRTTCLHLIALLCLVLQSCLTHVNEVVHNSPVSRHAKQLTSGSLAWLCKDGDQLDDQDHVSI